jgi:hypothetical protein
LRLQFFHLGEPLVNQRTQGIPQLQLRIKGLCKLEIPVQ